MNLTFFKCVVGLMLITMSTCNARAGLLEEACDLVYKKLSSGPYESLSRSMDDFVNDGRSYRGCVIRLSGNAKKVTDAQRPDGLFGRSLPYCPDGKLPANFPRELLNEDGWCGDRMADGPDGTSFRALKKDVFCAVEGRWDGGDDSDPKYVPSPRYSVIVVCASRK